MLLSKGFRRRHECALVAVLHGPEQRVKRHDRLSRADIALEQPLHRAQLGEVAGDLVDGRTLVGCELEREDVVVAADQLAFRGQRRRACLFLERTAAVAEPELKREELFEREPAVRDIGLVPVARAMRGE